MVTGIHGGGRTNERPGTDHVTSPDGANTQTHRHTDGHGDSMTESAQWANSVKMFERHLQFNRTLKN